MSFSQRLGAWTKVSLSKSLRLQINRFNDTGLRENRPPIDEDEYKGVYSTNLVAIVYTFLHQPGVYLFIAVSEIWKKK
jgi:hypothetical protein